MSSKGQSQHDQIFSGAKDFAHLYDDVIAESVNRNEAPLGSFY